MMTDEKILDHIKSLQERHDLMDSEIKRVESTHGNQMMIIDLKKKKLKLKDEIEKLKSQIV